MHVSTDEVYGDLPNKKKANESFKYNPSSPYSASKASGDQMIKAYLRTYKVNALIATLVIIMDLNNFQKSLFLR